jgi:DnaJ-class molecular chaperone
LKDPYAVLGVARGATADEIKQAYRALARELHPDLNPGDRRSEERFKEVSAAYDFLSDVARRGQYDRGEIDATGAPRRPARGAGRGGGRGGAGQGGGRAGGFAFGDDADDILSELLRRRDRARTNWGGGGGGAGAGGWTESGPVRSGQDAHHSLTVGFVEAAAGATKRVTLVTGKSLDVRIPPGSVDGQSLRLKGQGHPGGTGGPAGDAFIDIRVQPHPYFSRRDLDVLVDLPVSLQEAVLGAKVTVPTIDGKVTLTVPPGSNSGAVLRLKGKGIAGPKARGDQLVTLTVVLPDDDAELKKFVEKWGPHHGYDPRGKAGM